jgi:hypothetical protein
MGDVDRRKHDVDVIERVLGGVRETTSPADESTPLISVEVPWFGGSARSTVELTVGLSTVSERPRTATRGRGSDRDEYYDRDGDRCREK